MKKYIKLFLKIFLGLVVFITLFLLGFFYMFFYNKHYLVVLQNAGEARPGGGFYGSVALLDFNGFNPSVKIEDAYKYQILAKEKNVFISTPSYLKKDLMTDKIYFLNAHVYGISEKDLKNIKMIYEKTTDKKLDGVISLNSIGFEKISPKLRHKIWEWQFLNVLNYNRKLKSKFDSRKQAYLKDSKNFIKENFWSIGWLVLKNTKFFVDNQYLQVYIPSYSKLLKKLGLLTSYDKQHFYSFDFYLSFKKASRFVEKTIYVNKKTYKNKNIVPIGKNFKGKIEVKYTWNEKMIKEYENFIKSLEEKYNNKLNSEQLMIMNLNGGRDYNLSIFHFPSEKVEIPSFCEKEKNVVTCMHYLNKDEKDDMVFYVR